MLLSRTSSRPNRRTDPNNSKSTVTMRGCAYLHALIIPFTFLVTFLHSGPAIASRSAQCNQVGGAATKPCMRQLTTIRAETPHRSGSPATSPKVLKRDIDKYPNERVQGASFLSTIRKQFVDRFGLERWNRFQSYAAEDQIDTADGFELALGSRTM